MKPSEFINWLRDYLDGRTRLSDEDAGLIKKRLDETDLKTFRLAAQFTARASKDIHALLGGRGPQKKFLAEIVCLRLKDRLKEIVGKLSPVDPSQIGQTIQGEGVFLGRWELRNEEGKSLGRVFNVFAAPEDLTDENGVPATRTLSATFAYLSGLKNWHGHDGSKFTKESDLRSALLEETYDGGWIVPPLELVNGEDLKENHVQPDNMMVHKDKGDLKGTFTDDYYNAGLRHYWYWSMTAEPEEADRAADIRFTDGKFFFHRMSGSYSSCRPVRLVEILP